MQTLGHIWMQINNLASYYRHTGRPSVDTELMIRMQIFQVLFGDFVVEQVGVQAPLFIVRVLDIGEIV